MGNRRWYPQRRVLQPEDVGLDPLEKVIAGEIKRALEQIGFFVSSTQQRRPSEQTEGIPDLYASHAAWQLRVWIEVKRPGEKPSKVQREWHEKERAAGGTVLIATSAAHVLELIGMLRRPR